MATLEEFLRTGHLGPVVLGMTPTDVMTTVGDPQGTSRKSNPLQLKYGSAQLSFWKAPKDKSLHLREIAITYQPDFEPLPATLTFLDWNPPQPPTEQLFKSFIYYIGYLPVHSVDGPNGTEISFLSGVTALCADKMLHSIRLHQRQNKESTAMPLSDEREPTTKQILDMLQEAELALRSGAQRAALLLAWAGLEAALRRTALSAGKQGKIGVQPAILIRELFASQQLTPAEHRSLEELRQVRTALAHGFAPVVTSDSDTIRRISAISKQLLERAKID